MEFSNEGHSTYHKFMGFVLRDGDDQSLEFAGPRRQWLEDNYNAFQSQNSQSLRDLGVKAYHASNSRTAVVLDRAQRRPWDTTFEESFMRRILDQADPCITKEPLPTTPGDSAAEPIVDLFDRYLRYQGRDDKWNGITGGRSYFTERVRHFTSRAAPVQFCLPAFPCKSSNGNKVIGKDPDRGEELALERLHDFVAAIETMYPPGAKICIISDGHVFSDCIGVDDADVDSYGEKLKDMNRSIGVRRGCTTRVVFKSLVDFLLPPITADESLSRPAVRLALPNISRHIDTEVTEDADLCRRILMAGCAPQKSAVRAKIESKDAAITALYRGFSRFMLEDLEQHHHSRRLSRSQQKKLSAKVAFEMILRNQAYSNLVEMLFPNHIRLSIHAHNNAGPKFGVQLLDPSRVRAVEALSPNGELMTSLDLLHIPTPWHNCIVELAGSKVLLVTKAKNVRTALNIGSVVGGLVSSGDAGAYFSLRKTAEDNAVALSPTAADAADGASVAVDAAQTAARPNDSLILYQETWSIADEKESARAVEMMVTLAIEGADINRLGPIKVNVAVRSPITMIEKQIPRF